MGSGDFTTIESSITALEATAITVGSVIGLGLFVLPARLIGLAGPAFLLSVLVALVPLGFAILQMVQLGSAIPVAGGSYVYGSRLVHPYVGFLTPWVGMPAVWGGLLFTGIGFANYAGFYTDVPDLVLVYAVLLCFLGINLLGIRLVASVQLLLVAVILAGAAAFIGPGVLAIDPAHYTPVFPNGIGPAGVAAISFYPTFYGFVVVLQLGEELDDPKRSMPRVFLASALIGLTVIVGMVAVLAGLRHWSTLARLDAGFAVVSGSFLPWWGTSMIVAGALTSGLTSINSLYTGFSRSIMRVARDGAIPPMLADLHDRWDTPFKSILLIGVPPLLLAPFEIDLVSLSILVALALLLRVIVSALALWNLPNRYPDRYAAASLTLSRRTVRLVAVGSTLSTVVLMLALAGQRPRLLGGFLGWLVLGFVVYKLRSLQLARRNRDLGNAMRELHENE